MSVNKTKDKRGDMPKNARARFRGPRVRIPLAGIV